MTGIIDRATLSKTGSKVSIQCDTPDEANSVLASLAAHGNFEDIRDHLAGYAASSLYAATRIAAVLLHSDDTSDFAELLPVLLSDERDSALSTIREMMSPTSAIVLDIDDTLMFPD